MGKIKRVVSTGFWEDRKVIDDFSVEDRYFMLYLLTNPHTTQLGIYELPISTASNETGYNKDVINVLLDRFENKYGIIKYSKKSGEVAIKNYLKHSVVKGGKPVMDCLLKEEKQVSDRSLLAYIYMNNKNIDNTTISEYIEHIKNEIENDKENDNDNDNERIVDESSKKRKKSSKDLQFEILDKLLPAKSISIPLAEKIYEWIEYKTEKGNSYKERGLMVLLSQIEAKEQEYGSTALIDLIDTCMARNYQGIIFDILENKKTVKETGRTTNSKSNRNSNKGMLDSLLADIKKAEESGTENIVEERKGIF